MNKSDWGYTSTNGPSTWPSKFPQAAGSRQSPVDVNTRIVTSDTSLQSRPLQWCYKPTICKTIVNPGYGWRVDIHDDVDGSELIGGPLGNKYRLAQFHCHWGRDSKTGSEHTVDGKAYSGELHLVHWNCEKYSTFGEAAQHPDGLAVLGVFLEVDDNKHDEMEKIVALIKDIIYRGQDANINESIDPTNLFPKQTKYWTYLGSLTTPPCTECVTWIIFKEPILVSEEQLAVFRSMRSYCQQEVCPMDDEHNGQVLHNHRPPLPLGNRELRECGSA